jgi:bifunctional DNA-binding transcriptional regulator/antitoxin component of YhaV-PrlF toxin-antitoxin module
MRLQKQKAYKYKNKTHYKYTIVIPDSTIEKLNWKEGTELKEKIKKNSLLVKPLTKEEKEKLKLKKKLDMEPIYHNFRNTIKNLLKQYPNGLTWTEIKEKANLPQTAPNNKWVKQLEKDIGLKRIKSGTFTYWKISHDIIYTIGYEGKTIEQFIEVLQNNQIEQLIDVRQFAFSKKNGFSKGLLNYCLKDAGIIYKHFQSLGAPKTIRLELYKNMDYKTFFEEYKKHIDDPAVLENLRMIEGLANMRKTVLMCYEKDPKFCHRSIIANILSKRGWKIKHL